MYARIASCAVVETVSITDRSAGRSINCSRQLLPWADPYIAALAARLSSQNESASRAGAQIAKQRAAVIRSEAQPPVFPWTDYEIFQSPAERPATEEGSDEA